MMKMHCWIDFSTMISKATKKLLFDLMDGRL